MALTDAQLKIKLGALAALTLPTPDRIALARELLAGTPKAIAERMMPFPEDGYVPIDLRSDAVAANAFRRGWNACRAAMLAPDDGDG